MCQLAHALHYKWVRLRAMCSPGHLLTFTNSCVPCPAGWACLGNLTLPCVSNTWSSTGSSACRNCTTCADSSREVVACSAVADVLCHLCPVGFKYENGLCMPLSDPTLEVNRDVLMFIAFCLIVLLVACLCWKKAPTYSQVEPY